MNVEVDSKWQGFKGFFSGEGLFLLRCAGQGDLWFNTYGAMIEIPVDGNYVVDTSHVVAFTSGLQYNVESVGGLKSLFFPAKDWFAVSWARQSLDTNPASHGICQLDLAISPAEK